MEQHIYLTDHQQNHVKIIICNCCTSDCRGFYISPQTPNQIYLSMRKDERWRNVENLVYLN